MASPPERVDLPKQYDPAAVEQRRYAEWEAAGVFHAEPDPTRRPFIVPMPPPNITGRAHLGHGSTYTPMDILVRYHRMLGDNADWLPGQDHAAIATEAVLVRELAREGLSRESLGRERYLARAWAWREEYGRIIYEQFRELGFGPDWARDRFTMDAGLSAAVIKVFVQLYREGLIYRGTRLVNWDPKAQSTLSDAEVEDEERDGTLWHVRYPTEDGDDGVVVATTRPETMLGDVAVAVHPADERYRALVGKRVILPLANRAIPVIADAAVERAFGTGAVKVTPAHDPTDYEIGERHGLPMPTVIDFDGRMTGEIPPTYLGMDRYAARDAIVRDLERAGVLVASRPYRYRVPVSSRSGEVVEPLLSLQWFVKMAPLAKPALEAYRAGRLRFIPERFGRTYEQWLENIRDWNISRQIWWGHQLPVWYTPDDAVIVAETETEAYAIARERYGTTELRRDPDTLDTWFSSGLWPFSILGWPERTPELEYWYPAQTLITAREIIFLWVARMVMLGMAFAGDVPFRDVFIAPLVFDEQGRKMSKSLGNAIDPLDLVHAYGADATRFGIIRQMHLEAQELRFSERRCEEARRFNNKIWNALLYVRSLKEGLPPAGMLPQASALSLADRWILTRLRETIEAAGDALERYEFGVYAELLLSFIWYEFCDWYLEATKLQLDVAAHGGASSSPTRAAVLSYVLNAAMRLMHPVSPFVTEEVWQALPHEGRTIVTAPWPDVREIPTDVAAKRRFEQLQQAVVRLRNMRAELGLPATKRAVLDGVSAALDAESRGLLALYVNAQVPRVRESELGENGARGAAGASDGGARDDFVAALARVVVRADKELLRRRLGAEIEKLKAEVARGEGKLGNEAFVSRAPAEAVARERAKLAGYRAQLEQAQASLAALDGGAA